MSLLYQLVKYSSRIGLPIYFGALEINGKSNIPRDLPYIIAPNHQSAFLDAVLIGSFCRKPVHFLTRSDVFNKPFIGALNALNMMPVYRIRDGYEKLKKNDAVFAKCDHLLSQGLPVLIFPEGDMGDGHFLRRLTKGASRMAIQSQYKLSQDVLILPVGINYFHHDRPRYKCILNFGQPLKITDYLSDYERHKAKGLIKLRDDLSLAIKDLLVIPDREGYDEKVQALNRENEKYTFNELKEMIVDKNFKRAAYHKSLKWMASMLIIFNPLAIGVVKYLLSNVIKERQFTSSIKFIVGYWLSVIWWAILFITTTFYIDYKIATVLTAFSISTLLLRSEILKYTDEI